MKGAVRYHQDARSRRWLPRRSLGSRLTEWAPTVRILGGDRPGESADKGAGKQRHADEWIDERAERECRADEHSTPHRDVERVGFAADRISHIGSPVPLDVLLRSPWTVNT